MKKDKRSVDDLYPDLSPEERAQAEDNLKKYLELVRRIEKNRLTKNHPSE
jgi:hypothetical protein